MVYVLCESRGIFCQSTKESVGMGNGVERNTGNCG